MSARCECPACRVAPHTSSCAVHNAPALTIGECTCGAWADEQAARLAVEVLGRGPISNGKMIAAALRAAYERGYQAGYDDHAEATDLRYDTNREPE